MQRKKAMINEGLEFKETIPKEINMKNEILMEALVTLIIQKDWIHTGVKQFSDDCED